jgi:hypothetical protein
VGARYHDDGEDNGGFRDIQKEFSPRDFSNDVCFHSSTREHFTNTISLLEVWLNPQIAIDAR